MFSLSCVKNGQHDNLYDSTICWFSYECVRKNRYVIDGIEHEWSFTLSKGRQQPANQLQNFVCISYFRLWFMVIMVFGYVVNNNILKKCVKRG